MEKLLEIFEKFLAEVIEIKNYIAEIAEAMYEYEEEGGDDEPEPEAQKAA